ncbi:uncharacterized protein HaLaN_30974, partial [Haematococcus lacustris]
MDKLTATTLELYNFICEKLPPTPSRFHYVFNLRDLSRVYEGLLLSTPDKFKSAEQFLRLWHNEVLRVFHDRLINQDDKQLVINRLSELVEQRFPSCAAHALKMPILFGDYKNPGSVQHQEEGHEPGVLRGRAGAPHAYPPHHPPAAGQAVWGIQ